MNELQNLLNQLPADLKAKFSKDAYRIALFEWAVQKKAMEYVQSGNFAQASALTLATASLMAKAMTPKLNLANLFDPWKQFRDDARKFCKVWNLDNALVQELG